MQSSGEDGANLRGVGERKLIAILSIFSPHIEGGIEMDMSTAATRIGHALSDNSPNIMTGFAIAGTIATAYLSAKASFSAARKLKDASENSGRDQMEPKDRLRADAQLVWKDYIPAAAAGIGTIASIVMVNRIGAKRAAALAIAYSLSQRAFDEYRVKVESALGKKKEELVRQDIGQEHIARHPAAREVITIDESQQLFWDDLSGRQFASTMEDVRRAENDINAAINRGAGYVSLNTLFEKLGLATCALGEELGWNLDIMCNIEYTSCLVGDRSYVMLKYPTMPVRNYDHFQR
jgi:hypothetical protein